MSLRRLAASTTPAPIPLSRSWETIRSPQHLPRPLTTFVGRQAETQSVRTLLEDSNIRLVTLTGPGGVGKTGLAVHVAELAAADFPDGMAFVPLAEIRDPQRVAAAVAENLGVFDRRASNHALSVEAFLADRLFLLVLDNFEHVASAAPQLTEWLSRCPWLTILVTSRFRLRLSGEHEFTVTPFPVPDSAASMSLDRMRSMASIELFVERVQAARSGFTLTAENVDSVAAICARVEGLPLALELAAARLRHMSLEDVRTRLEHPTPFLVDGPRDQPDRLRSLENAIAWSYELLTSSERTLLQQLSVFSGGFDLDAAEGVARIDGNVIDGLSSLVDKSFLVPWELDGCSRYSMLESIRAFAEDKLDVTGATSEVKSRHAAYFVKLAEQEDEAIWGGPRHRSALDRLEIDLHNCRAALEWSETNGDGASLVRLAAALGGIWHYRSHWQEGRDWLEKGLRLSGQSVPAARATALIKLTIIMRDLGESPDPDWAAEAVRIRRAIQDERALGRALVLSATLLPIEDDDRKRELLAESETHSLNSGNATGMAWVCLGRASIRRRTGDHDGAYSLMLEALEWFRKDEFYFGESSQLILLADFEVERGRNVSAGQWLAEMLGLWAETRSKELLVAAVRRIAKLTCERGDSDGAVALLSSLASLGQTARLAAAPQDLAEAEHLQGLLKGRLPEERFGAAWLRGSCATVDRLIADATQLARTVSVPASGRKQGVHGLTARELEVIQLLAAGKSNREIANDLSVSESTAISHVRSILTKLALNSRTAAATWAIRQGLDQPV